MARYDNRYKLVDDKFKLIVRHFTNIPMPKTADIKALTCISAIIGPNRMENAGSGGSNILM